VNAVDFGTLYTRYSDEVLRFALYLTGDRAAAEDIASETFVRAWIVSGDIRVGTVKAYLFTIARNLSKTWRRNEGRTTALDEEMPDPREGPEAETAGRDQLDIVLSWMQSLPEVDRAALVMRAQGDLSYETIAAALGLSVAAARVKVHRARLKLEELRVRRNADEDHA
jgi:RNA polymerase sigma-70 factor (ECF subfamily)